MNDSSAFPRGRAAPATAVTSDKSTKQTDPRQLRRGKSDKEKGKESQQSTKRPNDFLFGASNDTDQKQSQQQRLLKRSRITVDTEKHAHEHTNTVPLLSKSLMPLGGGGCVFPSSSSTTSAKFSSNGYIEPLQFAKFTPGFKLLAVVKQVQADLAVFSLPNLWTAYMLRASRTSSIPPLNESLHVHQIVTVTIVKARSESTPAGAKRRIEVTCDPAKVNPVNLSIPGVPCRGTIVSVEDHGLLVDLGLQRRGFLAFAQIQGDYTTTPTTSNGTTGTRSAETHQEQQSSSHTSPPPPRALTVHKLIDCLVHGPVAAGIVPLSLPLSDFYRVTVPLSSYKPLLTDLIPGMLVPNVTVEGTLKNGLVVSFGPFRGSIELPHTGTYWIPPTKSASVLDPKSSSSMDSSWRRFFEEHTSLGPARILAVDPKSKLIRLTLLPHLLALSSSTSSLAPLPPTGTVVTGCPVIRLDPGLGALLALPEDSIPSDKAPSLLPEHLVCETNHKKPVFKLLSDEALYLTATRVRAVYVHISKALDVMEDGKVPEIALTKQFAVHTKHDVRIVSTENFIEGIASGATAPSIVNAHVLTLADVAPGQVYKQVPVCAILGNNLGILVDFGLGVRGLIPPMHLFDQMVAASDFRNKMIQTKYAVGARVDVRVLSMDVMTKKCFVTAKKSLLKEESIITSYDNVQIGQVTTGVISKIDADGLFVTFFNGVYGRVTARSLTTDLGVENHEENYHRGDVVRCRVLHMKKRFKQAHTPTSKRWQPNDAEDDAMEIDEAQKGTNQRSYYYQLTLSLRLDGPIASQDDNENENENESISIVRLAVGAILPVKSLRVVELVPGKAAEGSKVYVPGYAIVRIKSKYMVGEDKAGTMPAFVECKLPYDQLLDHYAPKEMANVAQLDAMAQRVLTVGKKINRKGFVLTDPKKSNSEYLSGTGPLAVVSIRPDLVKTVEQQARGNEENDNGITLPGPTSHFLVGSLVHGYVTALNERHGAFIRFLDGMTGLVPKVKLGLRLKLYSSVVVKVVAVDDKLRPPKVLLGLAKQPKGDNEEKEVLDDPSDGCPWGTGDFIKEVEVKSLNFHRCIVTVPDDEGISHLKNVTVQIHCTMASSCDVDESRFLLSRKKGQQINEIHPFHTWKVSEKRTGFRVFSVKRKGKRWLVDLTNRTDAEYDVLQAREISHGDRVSGIVIGFSNSRGIWLQLSPTLSAYMPGLEASTDVNILNNLSKHFLEGSRVSCVVMDKKSRDKTRSKYSRNSKSKEEIKKSTLLVSILGCGEEDAVSKPLRGDLIVGRIDRTLPSAHGPDIMLDLRSGFVGRCCVTELDEIDEWTNLPFGRHMPEVDEPPKTPNNNGDGAVQENGDENENSDVTMKHDVASDDVPFAHGMYVACRVLSGVPSKSMVEVSFRPSRIDGDLDDDSCPVVGDTVQAYVVGTSEKGCFLRISRQIEGRTLLKELCDGFLPHPASSFPPGRLVVGKVKNVREANMQNELTTFVDVDMRESVLVDGVDGKLSFDNIDIGGKYKGTVSRIEDFGVFVRVENSEVSGLVHMSECSDMYVKNLADLYDPGDLVKLIVVKKDVEKKQLGFSMKASHFEDDEESEDESVMNDSENEEDLAHRLHNSEDEARSLDESSEDSDDETDDDDDDNQDREHIGAGDEEEKESATGLHKLTMDTNVGFDWNGTSAMMKSFENDDDDDEKDEGDDDDDDSSSMENDDGNKSSRKSRNTQSQRRKEELEISQRESALADGTADENPETAIDFERLLASDPNSSELWIRYMVFHLTLADIPAARQVANRAFEKIEFRQEIEKLNVWCALLSLELKYGDDEILQATLNRACQHNNPKHVYLRMCEMMEKQAFSSETSRKTDEMYAKMCKKFKDKKTVWIANIEYTLKKGRFDEASSLSKRALMSLRPHKHVETLSKYAQLVFQYGQAEKARTLFEGLLTKFPKRLDLLTVYADKEIKFGDIQVARSLFVRAVDPNNNTLPLKFNDKQMKRLFKKWFSFEESHGTEKTQENVKNAARSFVEQ